MKAKIFSLAVAVFLSSLTLVGPVSAGLAEGHAAYEAKDYSTAFREYSALAKTGRLDDSALFRLSMMYFEGNGVAQDYKLARLFSQAPAENGHPIAQLLLGRLYQSGLGVPQDSQIAVKWFREAASQGVAVAQYSLGMAYIKGEGVSQNTEKAINLFQLGANQGHGKSQISLGVSYYYGVGVPIDFVSAVKWYRLAAEKGLTEALYLLAGTYLFGQGVPKNYVIAYSLSNLAASGEPAESTELAIKMRDTLYKNLSVAQIEAGQQLSRDLAKPGNFLKALDSAQR